MARRSNALLAHRQCGRADVDVGLPFDSLISKRTPINSGVDACRGKGGVGVLFPGGAQPVRGAFLGQADHALARRRVTVSYNQVTVWIMGVFALVVNCGNPWRPTGGRRLRISFDEPRPLSGV